jgi:hypothetical protein
MSDKSEFYIGYLPHAPQSTSRFLRKIIIGVLFIIVSVGFVTGFVLEKVDRGSFDFGLERSYQGTLIAEPIPILRTAERSYILVGDGKFGADEWARKWAKEAHGQNVKLRGTLINRDPVAMLEIDRHQEPAFVAGSRYAIQDELLGSTEMTGEIVDSKCYLGVMRPAVGKVHRGCAIRCLAGGVPPGILIRKANIDASVFVLLTNETGQKFSLLPQWAGRSVRAKGQLHIRDGVLVLLASSVALAP